MAASMPAVNLGIRRPAYPAVGRRSSLNCRAEAENVPESSSKSDAGVSNGTKLGASPLLYTVTPVDRPTRTPHSGCECHDLYEELVPYVEAWRWQKDTVDRICTSVAREEEPPNCVILLQHPPVYTMGTRSSDAHLLFDKNHPPFELHKTERGGELVMYPILNLRHQKRDLHWYLRTLEEVVIRALWSSCRLRASRIDGLTGVWIGDEKVAAIGVRVSRWITYHGLALNVTNDLAPFENIVPCGITDRRVGNIKQLLRQRHPLATWGNDISPVGMLQDDYELLEDATLLDRVHQSLLSESAELFQMELVAPVNKGPQCIRHVDYDLGEKLRA
ncbi:hypothetical protein R1sor_016147 [Riccia sorocarpa]|uniref:lipoyl(octanoyl) transferase n=1 Tax=Riccia sorocarpa TaxID=122646 RepID=A0ABD3HE53_9MARC